MYSRITTYPYTVGRPSLQSQGRIDLQRSQRGSYCTLVLRVCSLVLVVEEVNKRNEAVGHQNVRLRLLLIFVEPLSQLSTTYAN